MPRIKLEDLDAKTTRHPDLPEALSQIEKVERIAITVPATYARAVKAAAKGRGLTIKQFVMQALDTQFPNLQKGISVKGD